MFGALLPDCLVCPSFGITDSIFQALVSPSVDCRDVYQFRWGLGEGPRGSGALGLWDSGDCGGCYMVLHMRSWEHSG